MRQALAFLSELSIAIPPDVGAHALLLRDGRLIAQVRHHRIGQTFFLDDGDLQRDPSDLVAEVKEIVDRNFARTS